MVLLGISPYITCSVLSGSYLLRSSDIKADKLCKELQALGDELSKVLPSVSSHIMQFSRWMESVRKTCLNLEHINREPNEYPVGSEDITRQQQLITLNEYIMRMAASTQAITNHRKHAQQCCRRYLQQEIVKSDPLPVEQVKEQPTKQMCTVNREHSERQDSIEDQQPGPRRGRQNVPEWYHQPIGRWEFPSTEMLLYHHSNQLGPFRFCESVHMLNRTQLPRRVNETDRTGATYLGATDQGHLRW